MKLILWLLPVLSFAQQEASAPDPRELMKQAADAMKKYQSYQLESTVAINTRGEPIEASLKAILDPLGLTFYVAHGLVSVTSKAGADVPY